MKLKTYILLILVIGHLGCAESIKRLQDSTNTNMERPQRLSAEEQIKERHEKFVGQSEDDLIEALGAPDRVENIGSFKIFYYMTDRGATSEIVATGYGHLAAASGRSKSHGQVSRFYFKSGKVTKWDYGFDPVR